MFWISIVVESEPKSRPFDVPTMPDATKGEPLLTDVTTAILLSIPLRSFSSSSWETMYFPLMKLTTEPAASNSLFLSVCTLYFFFLK